MTSTKIKEIDIASLKVASLPSRPTAPKSFGGAGYTATEMKQAFDRLPLYIISRFNELIDDIGREGDGGLCAAIPTGIDDGHTLADMLEDISSGAFSSYLDVLGIPLSEVISELRESLRSVSENAESSAEDRASLAARAEALEDAVESLGIRAEAHERSIEECSEGQTAILDIHKMDIADHESRIRNLEDVAVSHRIILDQLEEADALTRLDTLSAHASTSEARLESLEAARDEDRAILAELEAADVKANLEALSSHADSSEDRLDVLETARAEDRALLDSVAAKIESGGTTDKIIDCGGPMDLV